MDLRYERLTSGRRLEGAVVEFQPDRAGTGKPQPRFFRIPASCVLSPVRFRSPGFAPHPASTQINPPSASAANTIATTNTGFEPRRCGGATTEGDGGGVAGAGAGGGSLAFIA